MRGYLLDTNHVSAAMLPASAVRERANRARKRGFRVGTCVPVVCELLAGLQSVGRRDAYLRTFKRLVSPPLRLWPLDLGVARFYSEVYQEIRKRGRVLSQIDIMVAALARSMDLVVLTTDKDFDAVSNLRVENWLS